MSRRKTNRKREFREEFAFDLTPDVNEGEHSSMHCRGCAERGRRKAQEANSAPDDVEWGPSVRGHDFRVN